jgi:hypothetical protein
MAGGERLGGYVWTTITGAITRLPRLPAPAQPAPLGRMVVLTDLEVDIEREHGSVVNLRDRVRGRTRPRGRDLRHG